MLRDRTEAVDQLAENPSTSKFSLLSRMGLLGILHGWRTCTDEQAAAILGSRAVANPKGHVATAAFSSVLVEYGTTKLTALAKTEPFGKDTLLRPARPDVFADLSDRLTWGEWLAVTGGQPWASGGQYDRHNILATELGLRLAEYADIGTVLGERFSTVDLLTGSGVGREVVGDQRTADLSVIREDGMVIAVEITATISPNFDRKVERWADLLATSPIEATGLTVLFVVAQPSDVADAPRYRARTYQAVARAVRNCRSSAQLVGLLSS
jgi:hypothetical protein